MNIVFLIGNGFDINLGLKTSYSDFYKYYKSVGSDHDLIKQLKDSMDIEQKNWSDMELALGKYTVNLKDMEDFKVVFNDIEDRLADYLNNIENDFDNNNVDKEAFFNHLTYPENFLTASDKRKLDAYRQNWINNEWNISIITFNYTKIIEKIIDLNNGKIEIAHRIKRPTYLNELVHIHGYIDERMVMGVNDISQISNEKFHENLDILDTLMKSRCNQVQKHLIDESCIKLIDNADMICVFGSSLGETDKFWWELVGKQLRRDCKVIIFIKDGSILKRRLHLKASVERQMKQHFFEISKFPIDKIKLFEDNLFIGIDTEIFSIIKPESKTFYDQFKATNN